MFSTFACDQISSDWRKNTLNYKIEIRRLTCHLKDWTKGAMASDSIRFIGGENKVYLH